MNIEDVEDIKRERVFWVCIVLMLVMALIGVSLS